MSTFLWIIAALAIFNAFRMMRNKAKQEDTQKRLNYERYAFDKSRSNDFDCSVERAGHRRAAEHEWSNK